jgi:hypothetical protein
MAPCGFIRCRRWDDDVATLLGQVARAIHRLVERRLAQGSDDEPPDLLASEQAQAIAGPPLPNRRPGPRSTSRRSAFLDGYSLHADHFIDANDRDGLDRLCRYGARSPVANARLSLDPTGRVVSLKRPLRDGRTALAFTPLDFLRRLAALIPPLRSHLTRYHGVFAPNHHLRAAIVPSAAPDQPAAAPRRWLNWADLLKRVFAIDVLVCDSCGGSMCILAVLPEGEASRAILEHFGLSTEPLPAHTPPGRRFGND